MGNDPDPKVPAKIRRRQFSAHYRAEVLAAYDQLARPERGAFLRRDGFYSSNITRVAPSAGPWRPGGPGQACWAPTG